MMTSLITAFISTFPNAEQTPSGPRYTNQENRPAQLNYPSQVFTKSILVTIHEKYPNAFVTFPNFIVMHHLLDLIYFKALLQLLGTPPTTKFPPDLSHPLTIFQQKSITYIKQHNYLIHECSLTHLYLCTFAIRL